MSENIKTQEIFDAGISLSKSAAKRLIGIMDSEAFLKNHQKIRNHQKGHHTTFEVLT